MSELKTTADLMIRNIVTCTPEDSLATAREIMKEKSIRHIPVVNKDSNALMGVITQKNLLKEAFDIADKFGMNELEYQEKKRLVKDFMDTDVKSISPQTPLLEAGEHFIKSKHGCLPVLENDQLVGILTSSDFVKLSVDLLR